MKATKNFDRRLIDQLRQNEKFREAYLNEALNEADGKVSLLMFRHVAEALGGITRLAKHSGLNRQNLYKALSGEKDPAFSTVEGIIHGFGFQIKVAPTQESVGRKIRPTPQMGFGKLFNSKPFVGHPQKPSLAMKGFKKMNLGEETPKDDLAYWMSRSADERIGAVEILRKERYGSSARLQRDSLVIKSKQS